MGVFFSAASNVKISLRCNPHPLGGFYLSGVVFTTLLITTAILQSLVLYKYIRAIKGPQLLASQELAKYLRGMKLLLGILSAKILQSHCEIVAEAI